MDKKEQIAYFLCAVRRSPGTGSIREACLFLTFVYQNETKEYFVKLDQKWEIPLSQERGDGLQKTDKKQSILEPKCGL